MEKSTKVVKLKTEKNAVVGNNQPKPSMNGKLLRKKDFERVIEHDKIYLEALKQALDYYVIKQEKLHYQQTVLLKDQSKENIRKNIDLLCEYADVRIRCMDLRSQMVAQDRLFQDKVNHYHAVFIPQFNKEMEECKANFETTYKDALTLVKEKPKMSEEIVSNIEFELYWWNGLTKENQQEDEYKLELYQPLKRLLGAYARIEANMK